MRDVTSAVNLHFLPSELVQFFFQFNQIIKTVSSPPLILFAIISISNPKRHFELFEVETKIVKSFKLEFTP